MSTPVLQRFRGRDRDDDCDGEDIMDVDGDGFNGGPDGEDCMDSNP